MNTFTSGIALSDGMAGAPSMCFSSDTTTGLFFNTSDIATLSVAVENNTLITITPDQVTFTKNIQLALNAFDGAVLTSDANGTATWQTNACNTPTLALPLVTRDLAANANGVFAWNSVYTSLDFTQTHYKKKVVFAKSFVNAPAVIITKETSAPIDSAFDLYITDKTESGFFIYSNFKMFATLLTDIVGDYSSVRLYFGGVGIAYFSKTTGKVMYVTVDDTYNTISTPLVIDTLNSTGLVSMIMAGATPAIAYSVYNNVSLTYEFRYVVANDVSGITFRNPTQIYNTTSSANQQTSSLVLLNLFEVPTVFLTTETGNAMVFACSSLFGSSFSAGIQIANLNFAQIISVQVFNGLAAVLAINTATNILYYVQSSKADASIWPVGAIQFIKPDGLTLLVNPNKQSCTMGLISGVVNIIASEFGVNTLYIISANVDGFGQPKLLILDNTPAPFVRLVVNNGITYLLYNTGIGPNAVKTLIQFAADGTIATETDGFINTLNAQGDNQFVQNKNDGNSAIVINTDTTLVLLRFFSNDFIVNWIAVA